MGWRTHDEIVTALAQGQTVGYGCGCSGVPFRTFGPNDGALVPPQDQITADEAACEAAAAGPAAVLQVQLNALQEQLMSLAIPTATVTRAETQTKTAAYAMVPADSIVPADTTAGAFNVTLPPQPPSGTLCILFWKAGASPPAFVPGTGDAAPQGSPFTVIGTVGSTLSGTYDAATKTWTYV